MKMATRFDKIIAMTTKHKKIDSSLTNKGARSKAALAEQAFATLLSECSRSGYFGSVSLTISVQDGHIQHVRIATERQLK